MSNGGNKRSWFSKTFGGSPDPAKTRYENRLREITPQIQLAAQNPLYKNVMAQGLKEAGKLAKRKNYDGAVERLNALARQAELVVTPSLATANNAPALRQAAQRLLRLVAEARNNRVLFVAPSLDDEESRIRELIEQGHDVDADQNLDDLEDRINRFLHDRNLAQQEYDRIDRDLTNHGVTLPPDLANSLDGLRGLVSTARLDQVRRLIGPLDVYINRAVIVQRENERRRDRGILLGLGEPKEIDDMSEPVVGALSEGKIDTAESRLKGFVDWSIKREARVERLAEGLEDVRDSVETYGLTLTPPAKLDDDEGAIRGLMRDGKLHQAELGLTALRTALGVAADVLRLTQVLERLLDEEQDEKRVEPNWLANQAKSAREFLTAADVKNGQIAIKKIRDQITEFENQLEPEDRRKVVERRAARQLDRRKERVLEMAKGSLNEDLQQCARKLNAIESPYDDKKLSEAAELYTRATLLAGQGTLEGQGGSANSVLILKTTDRIAKGRKYKQFFKPVSGESAQPGFPQGGGACREVLGKSLADKMVALTGLPIHVAETHLIELPPSMLPEKFGKQGPSIGSLQHNVHHKGDAPQVPLVSLKDEAKNDLFAKIPKKRVQAKQVYDLVFLNLDVHEGNIFVKGEGEDAQLDGIDNGMGLPSKEGLLLRSEAFGLHALSNFPANSDKFDPEVVQAIEKLDEQALEATAKQSFGDMQSRFPASEATSDDKMNDEHLGLMKASVRFLKKAAKELTVNELQNAYLVGLQDIFGLDDSSSKSEEERFQAVIMAARERGAALEECRTNEKAIIDVANKNNWLLSAYERGPIIKQTLLKFYPRQYVAIWRANGGLKGPLGQDAPVPPEVPLDQYSELEIEDFVKALGGAKEKVSGTEMKFWRAYQGLGGDKAVQRLGGALSASPLYSIIEHRYKLLWQLTELRRALDKIPV